MPEKPAHRRAQQRLGAALMTLLLVLVMLVPMVFLVGSLASGFDSLREGIARPSKGAGGETAQISGPPAGRRGEIR